MEKKFYGPKPSYVFMKQEMKGINNEYTSFYYHGMNLVYYCIKHDFNEQQVNEYLDKEIQKCKKYLKSGHVCIFDSIPYHIYKDIINTSKNDFKLNVNRKRRYDYKNHKFSDQIDEYCWYEWVNNSIKYTADDNRYKTFFRQCSEHSLALDDLFKRRGYCSCEIKLEKKYDEKNEQDKVYVIFRRDCNYDDANDFKRTCLNYWHFIKLLDCVTEEDKNDIDIDELYKRKEAYDKLYDATKPQEEIKHTRGFKNDKESILTKFIKIFK